MRKYEYQENVDIIQVLGEILDENTKYYKSDFDIDQEILKRSLLENDKNQRRFLWISRESGTHCCKLRDVFMKHTEANIILRHFDGSAGIRMAYISVNEKVGEKLFGDVQEIDFQKSICAIKRGMIPVQSVFLEFSDGTKDCISESEYIKSSMSLCSEHKGLEHKTYLPEDESQLQCILNTVKENWKNRKWDF